MDFIELNSRSNLIINKQSNSYYICYQHQYYNSGGQSTSFICMQASQNIFSSSKEISIKSCLKMNQLSSYFQIISKIAPKNTSQLEVKIVSRSPTLKRNQLRLFSSKPINANIPLLIYILLISVC
ncbi:hypothetical protein TTHERM_000059479 (macronuclear) [Tetrahymena thermophila SB210]|uniref:Uncharacterized protein n=1 Tax=Tetrahymena thermophila (strain SB210) TaxID=312017 RepID=W7XLL3_TETTS|nr:hypothetical protein TTHERM_000059479 [Tetrahymena thermophila SB210]EWS76489.1 hypothetical protein TTHERM_000059479 [Tetrahymena thermophila SB210]|eukprot:XP_012650976.1 hypothetical protein TTHERM_000059479 [Tetrahymena thermophila SB210]